MHIDFYSLIAANENYCVVSRAASENGKRFEVVSMEDFTRIRIDDGLINSMIVEKCDFGFVRHSNQQFYFVELKGTEIQKAYNQIISTINYFQKHLIAIPKENRFGFIVSSSVPKAGVGTNILKQNFAKKHGRKLEIKNKNLKYKPE